MLRQLLQKAPGIGLDGKGRAAIAGEILLVAVDANDDRIAPNRPPIVEAKVIGHAGQDHQIGFAQGL